MRMTKKLFTTLLALAMAMALALPAFAAAPDNYSITINNDQAGHTYQAYQIFSGTVSNDDQQNGEAAGPMLGDIDWSDNIQDTTGLIQALINSDIAAFDGLNADTSTAADVAQALVVAADAAAFADIVVDYLADEPTGYTDTHVDNARYVIDGLPAGYYLVKDAAAPEGGTATDYIVQVLGNVTMEPKDTDIPTLEKKVSEESYHQDDGYGTTYNDVADWDIGDSVPFKLIGSIPDMSAYDTYEYIFTDTLSDGLTLQAETIKVYIARTKDDEVHDYTPLTEGEEADYILQQNVGENGGGSFSIIFNDLKTNKYLTGEHNDEYNYVIVTYDATLNANAEIGLPGNENSAYLEFSNDPNDAESTGQTAEDAVIVFTYELDGTKVDGENAETPLADAQFVLFNGGMTRVASIDENGQLVGWIEPDTINPDVEGNNDTEKMQNLTSEDFRNYNEGSLIITSGADGTFKIAGLDDGTYLLREIKAPDGYNLLEDDVKIVITATTDNGQDWDGDPADALTGLTITVNDGDAKDGDLDTGVVELTVANNQGATLPETGGVGTTLFYIIGGVLVVAAVVVLVARRRAGSREE